MARKTFDFLAIAIFVGALLIGLFTGFTLAAANLSPETLFLIETTTVGNPTFTIRTQQNSQAPAPSTGQVTISGLAFYPQTITVILGLNNTVTWQNEDDVVHTVTNGNGEFDSGLLQPGNNFQFTFSAPGTYSYYCQIHQSMNGEVIVKSA